MCLDHKKPEIEPASTNIQLVSIPEGKILFWDQGVQ